MTPNEIHIVKRAWINVSNPMQEIRIEVFVKEQNVPPELEWDDADCGATHFLAQYDNEYIGTARLCSDGHLGRMAVREPFRGQGVGKALIEACEKEARRQKIVKIILNAQSYAIPFYEKMGYEVTSEAFMEAGIEHQSMARNVG